MLTREVFMATSPTALHPLGPRWAPPSVGLSFLCLPDSGPAHPTQVPCPGILNNVEGHQRPPHPLEQDPSSRPRVPGEGPGPGECVGWGPAGRLPGRLLMSPTAGPM